MAILVLIGSSYAVTPPYEPGLWVEWSHAVLVGTVVSVEASDVRELEGGYSDGWFFPHDEIRIVVAEVLKNETERSIAIGDTISVYYATGTEGISSEEPNAVLGAPDAKVGAVSRGQSGGFSLRLVRGEWRSTIWCYYREMSLVEAIRSAAAGLSAQE